MRILILGGSGRIGSELLAAAERKHLPHLGTYCTRPRSGLKPLDVRDADGVSELLADYEPDAVVWAAPARLEAVSSIAKMVAPTRAIFALVSGDGVLGECKIARREEDALNPVGELAGSQAACEQAVRVILPDRHLIARTGFVFGTRSKSDLLNRLIRQLAKGETVLADDDAVRMPTFAADFADAVVKLLGNGESGTFHLVGPDKHTEFSFARTAALVYGLDADLIHQRTAFDTDGPAQVNLDRFKAMSALGRTAFRRVGDGVRAVRDRSRVVVPALKAA